MQQQEIQELDVTDVRRRSVAEFLDPKDKYCFFVPDYQRGYRWKTQQVQELLEDLLTFAITEKDTDNYYCLQPLVVRNDRENGRWEVIDGQQRLTTLKIILHYLKQRIGEEDWGLLKVGEYSITYATREKSNGFIESLGTDNDKPSENEPIDFFHMRNAYDTVRNWFYSRNEFVDKGAPELCEKLGAARDAAIGLIKDLLVRKPSGNNSTAQFLWYEIGNGESSIRLFNRLNTGKLELTDAELIKGLFLLRTNFTGNSVVQEQEQFRKAVNWERMENALHDDSFWRFLTPRRYDCPNRIDLLLELVYRDWYVSSERAKGVSDEDISKSLTENLKKKHVIFNHYNDLFNVDIESKRRTIEKEWRCIEETFGILEDWYSNPLIYNLIGFLCQTRATELQDIYEYYVELKNDADKSRQDFIDHLKQLIKNSMNAMQVYYVKKTADGDFDYTIDLSYGNANVLRLLLLLNIDHLNRRAADPKLRTGELDICKFPFAILDGSWDIEHVDSRTTNDLSSAEDRQTWLETAMSDLAGVMTESQRAEVERLMRSDDPEREQKLISYLRHDVAKEEDPDEEGKDNVRNLVLLDAVTNRSYKNSLFITKRKKIIERREGGQYVPETTSYVFFKLFEQSANSRWQWSAGDMQCYANYIVQQLKWYLPQAKEAK